ncbi:MAG TPA: hypothetical protein VFU23_08570 [Gemmatimonadales bacterium]|nr:hypothetical protein [Gemmatimonadales bacterium]
MRSLDRAVALFLAALVAGLGFLPIASWIPGGHDAPWYGLVATDLLTGLSIAVGAGLVLAILSRRAPLWREGLLEPLQRSAQAHWTGWTIAVAALGFLIYAGIARAVFAGRPLLIDEIIQVFQARLLASGHLWIPAAPHQEFFSSLHLVEQDGRVYGQFPMGGPALLALGSLAGAEWLVNPVIAGLGVLVFGAVLLRIESRSGIRLGALLLFALAPFAAFMSGSHMNHVTALFWILLGMLGLVRAAATDGGRFRDGMLAGLGFGLAATIRPVDAMAFAAPAGLWLLLRAVRQRRVAALLGSGLGIAIPIALLGWANLHTTGAPFRFGYTVLWGRAHDLGFHATPWGPVHTPARGLELLNLYFLRLQTYFLESAAPALIPMTLALALTRRLRSFDRYLLAAGVLLIGLYGAYWHDGFYLGPRFMYPLLPLLAIWTARFLPAVREWFGGGLVLRTAVYATLIALLLGAATSLPVRVGQYRAGMVSLRWDPDRAAEAARVTNALVLVRESWGAELVVRMWALGVSRPDADAIYRGADPCALDSVLVTLEAAPVSLDDRMLRLNPLLADSGRLVNAESVTGDPSLRLTPGIRYSPRCTARIEANRSGFTLFPPLLLARRFGNVYARDLGPRDSLLIARYPDRPLYLLKPESLRVGAEPVFHPLLRDSLLAAWRKGE